MAAILVATPFALAGDPPLPEDPPATSAAVLTAVLQPAKDQQYRKFSLFNRNGQGLSPLEFHSIPVMGFFPAGGDATVDAAQLSTYFLGGSLDTFVFYNPKSKFSLINASVFLLGVDWTKLTGSDDAYAAKLAYVRFGPHFRGPSAGWFGALGFQVGYGFLLQSKMKALTTATASGVDISFTFTPGRYDPPLKRPAQDAGDIHIEALRWESNGVASVSWAPPKKPPQRIRGYIVDWCEGTMAPPIGCPEGPNIQEFGTNSRGVSIPSLPTDRDYRFRVCADYGGEAHSDGNIDVLQADRYNPTTTTASTRASSSDHESTFKVGADLGNVTGLRLDWDFDGRVVDSIGIRAGAGLGVTSSGSAYPMGFGGLATDFRLSEKWQLETTLGVAAYSSALPWISLAGQYNPKGPDGRCHINMGGGFPNVVDLSVGWYLW